MSSTFVYVVKTDQEKIFLRKTMNSIKINPIGILLLLVLAGITLYYLQGVWVTRNADKFDAKITINLKELLSAGIYAAERGGVEVVKIRKEADLNEKSKGETREGANNPVTDGDMKSHEAIIHGLEVTFPALSQRIISEEHENKEWDITKVPKLSVQHPEVTDMISDDEQVPINDITVWIDPLDATQEYTENLVHYVTTMVCVAINGKPVIGIIHKPFKGETTWAWVGKGHSSNLKNPSYSADLKTSPRIIVSRSHEGDVRKVAEEAFGKEATVTGAGGSGYKVMELFEGNADVYIHTTLIKKWDICAGNAILKEMTSKMTTLDGEEINYDLLSDAKNEGGLLASIWDHENFLGKLAKSATK